MRRLLTIAVFLMAGFAAHPHMPEEQHRLTAMTAINIEA